MPFEKFECRSFSYFVLVLQHDPWKEASAVYLHLERAVECCESIDNSRQRRRLTVTDTLVFEAPLSSERSVISRTGSEQNIPTLYRCVYLSLIFW